MGRGKYHLAGFLPSLTLYVGPRLTQIKIISMFLRRRRKKSLKSCYDVAYPFTRTRGIRESSVPKIS